MLASLVLASFTVSPERRGSTVAAPADESATAARSDSLSRGVVRGYRDLEEVEAASFSMPSPTPEPTDASAIEAVVEPLRDETGEPEAEATPDPTVEPPATSEPTPDPTPEATPEPTPEATPEPTPEPTPRPTPRPVPSTPAPVTNTTVGWAEARMLELMNASRARAGLVPLSMDVAVANTARAHSAAEAEVRYIYHDGPDGTATSRNVPACGTGWYGENTGKIWKNDVDALHFEFMNEPWIPINHRTNIMDPAFRRVGVGAVIGPDAMYITVVFCR
jgi:uncharacterized protein YkwD